MINPTRKRATSSENDVMLASASHAILLGFNVSTDQAARNLAEQEGVSIRLYEIIYRMIEDIEKALKGMLEPESHEVQVGQAQVRQVFKIHKVGTIAGCRVISGELRRNARIRVIRNGTTVHDGEVSSLKHEKDDVREVRQGFECGVSLKGIMISKKGTSWKVISLRRTANLGLWDKGN